MLVNLGACNTDFMTIKDFDFIRAQTSSSWGDKFHPKSFFRAKALIESGAFNAYKINSTSARTVKFAP